MAGVAKDEGVARPWLRVGLAGGPASGSGLAKTMPAGVDVAVAGEGMPAPPK